MGIRFGNIKFNNLKFSYSSFNITFFSKHFGIGQYLRSIFERRLESFITRVELNLSISQKMPIEKLLFRLIPEKKSLKQRQLVFIYTLDLISSYKGWRHSKGLPTRGQRT